MRNAILKRVRPLAEQLARDLVDVAIARIEAELGRLPEAFEVALSAFASEVRDGDSDRRVHDPVPQVCGGAGRGLHDAVLTPEIMAAGFRNTRWRNIQARAAAAPRDVAEPRPDADDGDDEHSWSKDRIELEATLAESRKLGGELPIPRSSWDL